MDNIFISEKSTYIILPIFTVVKTDYNDINFILESVHDHVVITDTHGVIKYVNPSFLRSSYYSYEEVIGKNMSIIKSGFHSNEFYQKFWNKISSGNTFTGTFKNKRKNGDFFWVKKTVSPIFTDDIITGYLSISSDITGYKAFESRLKEEFEFSDSVINTSQALIIVHDKEGFLVSVNNACVRLSGIAKEELIGKHFRNLLSNVTTIDIGKVFNNLVNEIESTNSFIAPFDSASGATHLIRWSNSVIRNLDGSTRFIISNGIDVTEEYNYRLELNNLNESLQAKVYQRTKDLEDKNCELHQAKQFLKKIVESVPALIFLVDIETKESRCLNPDTPYFALKELIKIMLFSPKVLHRLIHPDDLPAMMQQDDEPDMKKELTGIEFRIRNDNGEYVWLLRKTVPYEFHEDSFEAKSRISFFFDINDRKKAELRAVKSEKGLEEAQRIANTGNWEWNIKTNCLFWSAEIYRIFEVENHSFTPTYEEFMERVHPDDISLVEEHIDLALGQIKPYDIEHRVITPGMNIKYVRERGEVSYDDEGNPEKMIGTVQDITRQKQIEFRLKQNESRLEEAQRISQLGNWEWNVVTGKIFWSDEVYRIFEVAKETFELNYSNYLSKIHPDDRPFVEEAIGKVLSERINYNIVHRITLQNGASKYIRCKSEIEVLPDGTISSIVGTIQNINEQKLLQNKMEQSYQIIENSLNAVFQADLNGKINYANQAAAKLWGFDSADEMISRWPNSTDYWHTDSKLRALEILDTLPIRENIILFDELKAVRKDGSVFYPIFNASVMKDEHGRPIGFITSFFDMTEKIKIEKELAKYDERLQFIFTNTEEIIYAADIVFDDPSRQEIIFISDTVEKVLGYSKELFFKDLSLLETLIHPEDLANCKERLAELFRSRKSITCIFRIRHAKGHYIWIENKLTPNIDSRKQIVACYGNAREVTERILQEQALKESEIKYKGLYENATVGIFKTNAVTRKAVEANDVCVQLFGYHSKEEFLENFISSSHYVNESDRQFMLRHLPLKGFLEMEIQFRKANGEAFWAHITGKYLHETNEIEGVVIDITKKVVFEQELRKTIAEKELLLKEVHHRVKNNLQIVSGLLLLKIDKISDPKILAPLKESRDRIETISLVHEKLYQTESLSHISFRSYLEELGNILQQTYSDKKVDIRFVLPDLLFKIDTAIPMGLIFHELISNSIKHGFLACKKDNMVTITIESSQENTINIRYIDNGLGFDPQLISRSNSLGMKLVTGLIRQLGGKIQIDSAPGKGVQIAFLAQVR